jgi:hypothetical protein
MDPNEKRKARNIKMKAFSDKANTELLAETIVNRAERNPEEIVKSRDMTFNTDHVELAKYIVADLKNRVPPTPTAPLGGGASCNMIKKGGRTRKSRKSRRRSF